MKRAAACERGLTLVELVVSIGIVLVLIGISMAVFYSQRSRSQIKPIADGIVFTLERAKSDAISGKNGGSFGVHFASTSYTYFSGSSYSPSDPSDQTSSFSSQFAISDGFPSDTVVFSHLSGFPSASSSITITDMQDSSDVKQVSVSSDGAISVVK